MSKHNWEIDFSQSDWSHTHWECTSCGEVFIDDKPNEGAYITFPTTECVPDESA